MPDQFGADLVEAALEADGAVLGNAAAVLEAEDRVELVVRRGRADAARGQRPLVQRRAVLVEAGGRGLVEGRQELRSTGAEKSLDFALGKDCRLHPVRTVRVEPFA